eukprot:395713-Rhodomonas_salina.1
MTESCWLRLGLVTEARTRRRPAWEDRSGSDDDDECVAAGGRQLGAHSSLPAPRVAGHAWVRPQAPATVTPHRASTSAPTSRLLRTCTASLTLHRRSASVSTQLKGVIAHASMAQCLSGSVAQRGCARASQRLGVRGA